MADRRECLSSKSVSAILDNASLPSPNEQLDNFILWMGEQSKEPGKIVTVNLAAQAAVGTRSSLGLKFIGDQAADRGMLARAHFPPADSGDVAGHATLSLAGWERLEQLRRGRVTSAIAFMAMKFGDAGLDAFYSGHLKKAVQDTGFRLKRLDEGQPAGLIDDRLRVEIRQARFLIADLTHHNNGAYWEAGFAEGLGKPVIYMCRSDVFSDPTSRPHFDTNHHLTVVWSPGEEDAAVQRLKDTIRATLPDEAALTDPDDV